MPYFEYTKPESTWGDYVDYMQAGAWGLTTDAASLGRMAGGRVDNASIATAFEGWQNFLSDKVDANTGQMTKAGREVAQAAIGSKEFWEQPGNWALMQAFGSTPAIAASIAPVVMSGGSAAGFAAAAALTGGMSAGSVDRNIQQTYDNMSDEELATLDAGFAKDIMKGGSKTQARQNAIDRAIGNKPLWAFLAAAATAVPGPAGAAGRFIAGRAAKSAIPTFAGGALKRGAKEALSGLGGEAAQEGFEQYLTEAGQPGQDYTNVDWTRIAQAAATGGMLGGIFGGVAGAAGGVGHGRKTKASPAKPSTEIEPEIEAETLKAAKPLLLTGPRRLGQQPSPSTGPITTPAPTSAEPLQLTASATAGQEPLVTPSPMRQQTPFNPAAQTPSQIQQATGAPYEEAVRLAKQTGWREPVMQTRRGLGGRFYQPSAAATPEPAPGPTPNLPATTGAIPTLQSKVIMPDAGPVSPEIAAAAEGKPIEPPRSYAGAGVRAPYGIPQEPRDVEFENIPGPPGLISPPGTPRNLPSDQMDELRRRLQQPRPRGPPAVQAPGGPVAENIPGPGMPRPERPGQIAPPVGPTAPAAPAALPGPPQGAVAGPPQQRMLAGPPVQQAIPTGQIAGPQAPLALPAPTPAPLVRGTPNVPAVRAAPAPAPVATPAAAPIPRAASAPVEGEFTEVPEPKRLGRRILQNLNLSEEAKAALFRAGVLEEKMAAVREHEARKAFEPTGKHLTKAEEAKLGRSQKWAAKLLDKHAPDKLATGPIDRAALKKRLDTIIDDANKLKIEVKQAYEKTADPLVWLAEVKDLRRDLMAGKASNERIKDFLNSEHILKTEEDAGPMRALRKQRGEQQARKPQKEVGELPVVEEGAATEQEAALREIAQAGETAGLTPKEMARIHLAEVRAEETRYSGGAVVTEGRGTAPRPTPIPKGGPVKEVKLTPAEKVKLETLKFTKREVGKRGDYKVEPGKKPRKAAPKKLLEAQLRHQIGLIRDAEELGSKAFFADKHNNPFTRTGQEDQHTAWEEGFKTAQAGQQAALAASTKARSAAEEKLRAKFAAKAAARLEALQAEEAAKKAAKQAEREAKAKPKLQPIVTKAKEKSTVKAPKAEAIKAKIKAKKEPKATPVVPAEELLNDPEVAEFVRSEADSDLFLNSVDIYRMMDTPTLKGYMKDALGERPSVERAPVETMALRRVLEERGTHVTSESDFGVAEMKAPPGWDYIDSILNRPKKRRRVANIKKYVRDNNITTVDFPTLRPMLNQYLETTENIDDTLLGKMQEIYPALLSQMELYLKDMPVSFVDAKQMNELLGRDPLYYEDTGEEYTRTYGFYSATEHTIVLLEKAPADMIPHTLVHEAVHAAFMNVSYRNPQLRQVVELIAKEFKASLPHGEFYAFNSIDEFIAEAFSNLSMQKRMMQTMASGELAGALRTIRGLPTTPVRTVWDAFRRLISNAFGFKPSKTLDTLLDAMMHVGSELETALDYKQAKGMTPREHRAFWDVLEAEKNIPNRPWSETGRESEFPDIAQFQRSDFKKLNNYLPEEYTADHTKQRRMWMLWARSSDEIAQALKGFGRTIDNKLAAAARVAANLKERMRIRAQELMRATDPFQLKLYDLEKAYRGDTWDEVTSIISDMTVAGVDPAIPLDKQKHISPVGYSQAWARAQYPKLVARWNKLSPELQSFVTDARKLFERTQKEMQLGILKNYVMTAIGVEDNVILQKLYKREKLTPEELKKVGGKAFMNLIRRSQLASMQGPYFPQMRMGEYVTDGFYKITPPPDATVVKRENERAGESNIFEFSGPDAVKRAMDYAGKSDLPAKVERAWVDPDTGEKYFTDVDEAGEEVQIKATKQDENSEERYRVTVQNKYLKMHDTLRKAQNDDARLKQDSTYVATDLGPRRFNLSDQHTGGRELLSHEINDLLDHLEKRPGYTQMTPLQQQEMKQLFRILSINMVGSTRIQNRQRPRRNVLGASRDIHKTWVEYLQSSAGYQAKLEIQPQINNAVANMRKLVADPDDAEQSDWAARGAAVKELTKRIVNPNMLSPPSNLSQWTNRLTTVSFGNYLASPSYSLNGTLQVPMIAYPSLMGRHGPIKAFAALGQAYKDMDAASIAMAAVKETARAVKEIGKLGHPSERANYIDDIKARLNAGEKRMLDNLVKYGSIAPDAGLEIDEFLGNSWGDKLLDKVTNAARAAPIAVETINRVGVGLAAYRLELAKTGNEAKAILYAQEQVNLTQGNYSSTNMPPIFSKHPLSNIFFQFKKYGQVVYNILGHNFGKAVRNASPGERAEAIQAMAMIAGSHLLMAGILGVPGMEVLRWLVIGANLAGVTEFKWADVEAWERRLVADLLGQTGGELASRGLPRALGIDISGRVGAGGLFTYGEPRDVDDYAIQAFLGDLVGGAVGGTVSEAIGGVSDIWHGDILQGMQKVVPLKAWSDVIDAYRMATEGKETKAGYRIYDPTGVFSMQAFGKLLGYTSAQHAERSEQRAYFYQAQARETEARNTLLQDWAKANPREKRDVWVRAQKFNRSRDRSEQVTMGDFNNYSKRRPKVEKGGVVLNRRNRTLWQDLQGSYATEGYFGE